MTMQSLEESVGRELERCPPFTLELSAAQLMELVSLLQLALRHPAMVRHEHQGTTLFARGFVQSVREGFAEFPLLQMVIDRGSAPDPFGGMDASRPC